MTIEELEGVKVASAMRDKAIRLSRYFASLRYMSETLGLPGADEAAQQLSVDAKEIAEYLAYIEATFKDPEQLVRFIRGEHRTVRGSF